MTACVLDTVRLKHHERFSVHKSAEGAKYSSSTLGANVDQHGHSINSAEDRTPHEPSFAICMRLASRLAHSGSGLWTLTAFCVTVATSCELVAIVDRDGQGINSAGARTLHEPLSTVLMRVACSSRAVAITLASAHWQRVGQRPGPPLNAARSAVKAGACAQSCISRTLDFACGALTRCMPMPPNRHRKCKGKIRLARPTLP